MNGERRSTSEFVGNMPFLAEFLIGPEHPEGYSSLLVRLQVTEDISSWRGPGIEGAKSAKYFDGK